MPLPPREFGKAMENRISEAKVPYIAPTITTLSEAEILEEIGPARAYTGALPFSF